MTLDSELEVLAVKNSADRTRTINSLSPAYRSVAAVLIFLALTVTLQVASGAYTSEFSAYPDEPSHYVTSLMLRDYVAHFHFESPVKFAKDYYHHYPKVAFGHWPPFFYMVQAFWMLLFSASRASVRLEIACTTALLAYAVFHEARRWFGWKLGICAGLLTICLPLVQTYTDEEMAESLLTLMCFGSVIFFARYVDSERWRDSLLFGIFFSLAVLTKGSGWLLAMVPPIVIVLTRKWSLLKRPSFWAPFVLVSVLCVPWQVMTMQLAERGWDGGSKPSLSYTINALTGFLKLFPQILGPVLLCLMLVGIAALVVNLFLRGRALADRAAILGLLLAVWIFHSLVPAGVEDRKLVIAVPAMVLFVLGGAVWITDQIPSESWLFRWRVIAIGGLTAIGFFAGAFYIPKVRHYGFIEAARFLVARPDLKAATILVSSESVGEGLLVSEIAMEQPRPPNVIIRGTKSLASMEWNAAHYQSFYSNPAEIVRYLESERVQLVVMDDFHPQVRFPHNDLLRKTIQHCNRFQLLAAFPNRGSKFRGKVYVYKFI
jgi:hypothetical protein